VEGYRARWVGTYSDPNRLAMSLLLVVPLALGFATRRGALWVRLAGALAGGLALAAMVVTYSRGSLLGLVAAGVAWVAIDRRAKALALCAVVVGALLAFAPSSFWRRTGTVVDFQEDASARGRVDAWKVTSNISRARPLAGTGFNSFKAAWPLYAEPGMYRAYAAHNVFLQVIAENGWPGLLLFLIAVGGAVGGALASARRADGGSSRALGAAALGYLTSNLFAGFVLSPHLFVLLALCASADRLSRGSRKAEPPRREPGFDAPLEAGVGYPLGQTA
jgi:putative inorganic carbon (hco3(-)) transporter